MGLFTANLRWGLFILFIMNQNSAIFADTKQLTLSVDVTRALHYTDRSYLSVTISAGQLRRGLIGYDFSSEKFQNLAAALSPADVRIGGTYSDFLNFDPTSNEANCVNVSGPGGDVYDFASTTVSPDGEGNSKQESYALGQLHFTLSGKRWNDMTRFCDKVGWDILWDFNLLDSLTGPWDPVRAKQFLEFSVKAGVKIPMFELGNEPNLYERKFGVDIEASKLAGDYQTLKDVIAELPQYSGSGIYAPGVNSLSQFSSSRKYLAQFLQAQGCDVITEVALHHYYFKSDEADETDFLDLNVLESLRAELDYAYNITWDNCRLKKPLRFTETSSSSGGGVKGVSNAYVAGFLWLDKLGMSATYGITRVYRQTFLKSSYALVTQNHKPNPDYFTSLLFKRLVEGPVFQVSADTLSPKVRVYAHCVSKSHYNYTDGAIVIYYLNLGRSKSILSLGEFSGSPVDLFILTPGDENGMLSRKILLNGDLVSMKTAELPLLEPESHTGDVVLPSQSYGFIVIPEADVELCKEYHRVDDGVPISC